MTPDENDLERQRLKARYAEIAALAGGLAHEVRNPLGTINLNLELMGEELGELEKDSPQARRLQTKLSSVQRECERLEEILNDFLQFARAGELSLTAHSLNELLEEFIDFYRPTATEAGIDIRFYPETDLPDVDLDPKLFRQVLQNLTQNAQQAMPDGGVLILQTMPRDDRVILEIIDNGQGMSEVTVSRMFQAFYSTRSGGSGLGLPTVRKIVQSHRGEITCDSEPGRGTRFTISLPCRSE